MATLTAARGGFVGAADAAVVAAVDAVGAGVAAPPHAAARTSVARARPMFRLFIPISLSAVWVSFIVSTVPVDWGWAAGAQAADRKRRDSSRKLSRIRRQFTTMAGHDPKERA